MAVNSSSFSVFSKKIETDYGRKVDFIDVVLEVKDYEGIVHFTDIMFQGGSVATSWVGHVSEIRWSFDNA